MIGIWMKHEMFTIITLDEIASSFVRKRRIIDVYQVFGEQKYYVWDMRNLSSIKRKCRQQKCSISQHLLIKRWVINPTYITGQHSTIKRHYILMPNTPEIVKLLKE